MMTAEIINFPGFNKRFENLHAQAWRNVGVAVLNAAIRSGLMKLHADPAGQSASLDGPRRFAFQIESDLIAVPYFQESDTGLLLIRTNVFNIRDLAYSGEEARLMDYCAVAAAEHWFNAVELDWHDRKRTAPNMAVDHGCLRRLATIDVEPFGYPDWTDFQSH